MRGLSARERLLLVLVAIAAIAALFYLVIYSPITARQQTLRRDLAKEQTELRRLQELAATKDAREQEFAALAERIKLIEVRLPPEREIPTLIRQLQDAGREVGIRLTLLRPGATAAPTAQPAGQARPAQPQQQPPPQQPAAPPYQEFRLDLGFDGTYADLMAYLGRLENFSRFIVLRQVSVSPAELPKLRVTLGAATFVLPRERLPQSQP